MHQCLQALRGLPEQLSPSNLESNHFFAISNDFVSDVLAAIQEPQEEDYGIFRFLNFEVMGGLSDHCYLAAQSVFFSEINIPTLLSSIFLVQTHFEFHG